jgi:hypothetical protein
MKHLKSYNEGFLDFFKKDTNDDKITLDMIHRLEKVKDKNPYEIDEIMNTESELPSWMGNHVGDPTPDSRNDEHTEYFSKIYLVRFDDVDIVITNDRHDLIYTQTGAPAGYVKCKNPWKFFLGSDVANLSERIKSKESYRIKLFHLIDKIYKEDKERKRMDRIQTEINPAADLLEEGLFDFFSKKVTEDDKIALEYIKRLKKVKGISPYKITKDDTSSENSYKINRWEVDFEDTPIKLWSVISTRTSGFDEQSQELLTSKKLAKYSRYEFYGLNIKCEGEIENCKASAKVLKELVELVESVYENDKEARRIEHISINMNPAADLIDESIYEREVVFTNKRNPRLVITIKKNPDGRITEIENETGMRFPFSVGQLLQRNVEVWACNNNFFMDGKDTCPDKKIFGVKTKDVPQGHEWRHIFPHKF